MSGVLSVSEVASKYNMIFLERCNCGGYPTEKYSDGNYKLSWRRTKYVFQFKRKNEVIKDWTTVAKLEEYLKSFFESKN